MLLFQLIVALAICSTSWGFVPRHGPARLQRFTLRAEETGGESSPKIDTPIAAAKTEAAATPSPSPSPSLPPASTPSKPSKAVGALEISSGVGGFGVGLVAGGLLDGIAAGGDAPWASPVSAVVIGGAAFYGALQEDSTELSSFVINNLGKPVAKLPDELKQAALDAVNDAKAAATKKVDATVAEITNIPTKVTASLTQAAEDTKKDILNIPTAAQQSAAKALTAAQAAAAKRATDFVSDVQAAPGRAVDAFKAQATKTAEEVAAIPQKLAADVTKQVEEKKQQLQKALNIESGPSKPVAAKVAAPAAPRAPAPAAKAPEPVKKSPDAAAVAGKPAPKPAAPIAPVKDGGLFSFLEKSDAAPVKPVPPAQAAGTSGGKPAAVKVSAPVRSTGAPAVVKKAEPVKATPAPAKQAAPASGGFFSFLESAPAAAPVPPTNAATPTKAAPPAAPAKAPISALKKETTVAAAVPKQPEAKKEAGGGFFSFLDSAPSTPSKAPGDKVPVGAKAPAPSAVGKKSEPAQIVSAPAPAAKKEAGGGFFSFLDSAPSTPSKAPVDKDVNVKGVAAPAAKVGAKPSVAATAVKKTEPVAVKKEDKAPSGGGFFSFLDSAPAASKTSAPAPAAAAAAGKTAPVLKKAEPMKVPVVAKAPAPSIVGKKSEPAQIVSAPAPAAKKEAGGGFFSFLDSAPSTAVGAKQVDVALAKPAPKAAPASAPAAPKAAAAPATKAPAPAKAGPPSPAAPAAPKQPTSSGFFSFFESAPASAAAVAAAAGPKKADVKVAAAPAPPVPAATRRFVVPAKSVKPTEPATAATAPKAVAPAPSGGGVFSFLGNKPDTKPSAPVAPATPVASNKAVKAGTAAKTIAADPKAEAKKASDAKAAEKARSEAAAKAAEVDKAKRDALAKARQEELEKRQKVAAAAAAAAAAEKAKAAAKSVGKPSAVAKAAPVASPKKDKGGLFFIDELEQKATPAPRVDRGATVKVGLKVRGKESGLV